MDKIKAATLLLGLLVASVRSPQAADIPLATTEVAEASTTSQARARESAVSPPEQDPWFSENHIENVRMHTMIVEQARAEQRLLRNR